MGWPGATLGRWTDLRRSGTSSFVIFSHVEITIALRFDTTLCTPHFLESQITTGVGDFSSLGNCHQSNLITCLILWFPLQNWCRALLRVIASRFCDVCNNSPLKLQVSVSSYSPSLSCLYFPDSFSLFPFLNTYYFFFAFLMTSFSYFLLFPFRIFNFLSSSATKSQTLRIATIAVLKPRTCAGH